jgi:trigger factor
MADKKSSKYKVKILDSGPCLVSLSIEVGLDDVKSETEKVNLDVQKIASIPGFRQGKAPMELVKKNYNSTIKEKIVSNLIHKSVFDSLEAEGIVPISYPTIEKVEFDQDKPLVFSVKAERNPDFKLKNYKGLKIKKDIRNTTDEKVNESIEKLRERNSSLAESSSETVETKHFVVVDYDGTVDGQPVADLKGTNQLVDLSAAQLLAGFKEGLVGAKKDEEKTITVSLPADYPGKNLAGKTVIFKARVKQIKEKILPKLDDEFAKDIGSKDLAELTAKVREVLENEEKTRQNDELEKQLIDALLAQNEFCVPESLVEGEISHMFEKTQRYLHDQGIKQQPTEEQLKKFREKYLEQAKNNVRISYILNRIVRDEKIETTAEELAEELDRLKKANPGQEAGVEKYFEEHKENIAGSMKQTKLFKFLLDNSKIKEEIIK